MFQPMLCTLGTLLGNFHSGAGDLFSLIAHVLIFFVFYVAIQYFGVVLLDILSYVGGAAVANFYCIPIEHFD